MTNSHAGMKGFRPATGSDMSPNVALNAPIITSAKEGRKLHQNTWPKTFAPRVVEGRYRTQSAPLKRNDRGFEAITAAAVMNAATVTAALCGA